MTSAFTPHQEKILNAVQSPLPFVRRPFLVLEKELGIPENNIIETVRGLKEDGVIRNIAGIFNGESLGYALTLAAFEVPEKDIERAASAINEHPGVSHNYLRSHKYNIWFTIAEDNSENLKRSVQILASRSLARSHLIMKNERLIKIGFRLNLGGAVPDKKHNERALGAAPQKYTLTEQDKLSVLLLQKDMPLTERPFRELAAETELSEDELIESAAQLEENKIMRRYCAVLRHQKAGYSHNAMTAWKFNDSEDSLKPFIESEAVTHLYIRTLYPGQWEYPLFAMVHAKSENELDEIINGLSERSALADKLVLHSLREFKKQRVMYFSPDFQKWKEKNYD